MPDPQALSHLDRLEAESIIFRAVAPEYRNPVMMYAGAAETGVELLTRTSPEGSAPGISPESRVAGN